jgi:hypothetical protein
VWQNEGFEEAVFLGAQVAAKVIFVQDQGVSNGFLSRVQVCLSFASLPHLIFLSLPPLFSHFTPFTPLRLKQYPNITLHSTTTWDPAGSTRWVSRSKMQPVRFVSFALDYLKWRFNVGLGVEGE